MLRQFSDETPCLHHPNGTKLSTRWVVYQLVNPARIVVSNAQAESLFGYAPGTMAGLPLDSLIPEGHRAAHLLSQRAFFAAPSPRLMGEGRTLTGRRSDGSIFPVRVCACSAALGSECTGRPDPAGCG